MMHLTVLRRPGVGHLVFDVTTGLRRGPAWPTADLAADYGAAVLVFAHCEHLRIVEAGPLLIDESTDDGGGLLEDVLRQRQWYRDDVRRQRHLEAV